MKVKCAFESVNMGDEIIMVPVGENANQVHGVIKANEAGNRIVQLLLQGKNEDEVIDLLAKEWDNDSETIRKYVHTVVEVLRENAIAE